MLAVRVRVLIPLALAGLVVALAGCGGPSQSAGAASPVAVSTQGAVNWLAYQNGSQPWTALTASSFTVTESAGRYGFAWECTGASAQPVVAVRQATVAETASWSVSCPAASAPNGTIAVEYTAFPSTATTLYLSAGPVRMATSAIGCAAPPCGTTASVPPGSYDVVALAADASDAVVGIATVSGVVVTAGATTSEMITFASPSFETVGVAGAPSGESAGASATWQATGTFLPTEVWYGNGSSVPYPVVPVQSGDAYVLAGEASGGGLAQEQLVVTGAPGASTGLALPPALSGTPGLQVGAGQPRFDWGPAPFAANAGSVWYVADVTPQTATGPVWRVALAPGWLGSSTGYALPDFTATTGWDAAWAFPTGVQATARVQVFQANVSLSQLRAAIDQRDWQAGGELPIGLELKVTEKDVSGTY